ncbi:MAG TPA: hypothetical protein H9987_07200 [Candidatus Luteococcus avicola]|nr:hypothetical protein [Candidatus Luteococcus avicola]
MPENQNTEHEAVETDEPQTAPETPEVVETDEPETFPAEYVRQLRKEAADNRAKAKRADDYAHELFTARVGALGKLHDPADMPFDAALLDDPAKLAAAVEQLVERKPYMARHALTGNVGQGASDAGSAVDLAGMLRARA